MDAGTSITWWAVFSTLAGTILGSAISVTTSYLLQRKALNAAKEQRDNDRFQARKALGFALLFKMIKLASGLSTLRQCLKEQTSTKLPKTLSLGDSKPPTFQTIIPIAPLPEPISFTPDEMALVLSIDTKLFNEIAALPELHNSTVALFEMYNSKRNSVFERYGATMNGNITAGLTTEDRKWFDPKAAELNVLITAMIQRTEQDGREAVVALHGLRDMLENEFKMKLALDLKPGIRV